MTGATDGDVDRALAAMGATNLKYHSFGVMTVRPPGSDPLKPGIATPGFLPNPGLPPTGEGTAERYRAHAVSTVFPLLGLALPEAFQIDVEPEWPVGPPVSDPGLFLDPSSGAPLAPGYGAAPPIGAPVGHPGYPPPYAPPPYPGQAYPSPQYPAPMPPPGYPPQAGYPQTGFPPPGYAPPAASRPSFSMPSWLDPAAAAPPPQTHPRPAWLETPSAPVPPAEPQPYAQTGYPSAGAEPLPMGYKASPPEALPTRGAGDWQQTPPPHAEGAYSPFAPAAATPPDSRNAGNFPSWLDETPPAPRPLAADWTMHAPASHLTDPQTTDPHAPPYSESAHPMPEFAAPAPAEPPVLQTPERPQEMPPQERLQNQWGQLPDPANFEPSRYDSSHYEPTVYEPPKPEPGHSEQSHPEPIWREPPAPQADHATPSYDGFPATGQPGFSNPVYHPPFHTAPDFEPPAIEETVNLPPVAAPAQVPPAPAGRRPLADMFRTLGGGSGGGGSGARHDGP